MHHGTVLEPGLTRPRLPRRPGRRHDFGPAPRVLVPRRAFSPHLERVHGHPVRARKQERETRADGEGRFELRDLPAATYEIGALHRDFEHDSDLGEVELRMGECVEGRELRLQRGLTVTGTVKHGATGPAVTDVQVILRDVRDDRARRWSRRESLTGKSGLDGSFRVRGVSEGTYDVM